MSILKTRNAASKSLNNFLEKFRYMKDVPRFTVQGMNQAEFIAHIFIAGFMRGAEYSRKR